MAAALFAILCLAGIVQAQTFTTLYAFKYGTDGGLATGGLIQDSAGNLYGATEVGGNLNCKYGSTGFLGCGVIYKVAPDGTETVLYNFLGGTDGAGPKATLIRDAHGNFYGTTAAGGDASCSLGAGYGCGTIFKLSPSGVETVLYRFHGLDGQSPAGGLYLDKTGNLWGTTQFGGLIPNSCLSNGCGTLFRLDPSGKLHTHAFKGEPTDGYWPLGGLIADATGNIYGTTQFGGLYNDGTLFVVTTSGQFKLLHSFNVATDGAGVTGILLSGGKLYGPTTSGGPNTGGTVFALNLNTDSVLYSFFSLNDNLTPFASGVVARDPSGNIYGTTAFDADYGTVYEVAADGTYSILHYFEGVGDGENPMAGLIRDSQGNLYGTTQNGSTVFKLVP
jgi:uncharacterized repeat protein (TIGR03803 family)